MNEACRLSRSVGHDHLTAIWATTSPGTRSVPETRSRPATGWTNRCCSRWRSALLPGPVLTCEGLVRSGLAARPREDDQVERAEEAVPELDGAAEDRDRAGRVARRPDGEGGLPQHEISLYYSWRDKLLEPLDWRTRRTSRPTIASSLLGVVQRVSVSPFRPRREECQPFAWAKSATMVCAWFIVRVQVGL
jgi:hypothetical protein